MALRLEFYRDARGRQPALDYVLAQPKAHRAKIEHALMVLAEKGHLLRRPYADYVEDGIYELRAPLAGLQHRLLYFFFRRTIIVVACGFLKNEEKIPAIEIERARWRRADWLRACGG